MDGRKSWIKEWIIFLLDRHEERQTRPQQDRYNRKWENSSFLRQHLFIQLIFRWFFSHSDNDGSIWFKICLGHIGYISTHRWIKLVAYLFFKSVCIHHVKQTNQYCQCNGSWDQSSGECCWLRRTNDKMFKERKEEQLESSVRNPTSYKWKFS